MAVQKISYPNLVKKFPLEVQKIFAIFGDHIRLVGGCVRDFLLEKEVSDFDFATKFLPQEVVKILEKNKIKAVPTGVKFGTITAVVNGKNFEITTLRKDLQQDGRHCEVEFSDDFFVDAARRDFTINALYLDSSGLVTDYFDGIADLKNGVVKFIGDANERISEDFLRILRFFRFSAQYAKELDLTGVEACVLQRGNLPKLSRERIRQEFLKMFCKAPTPKVTEILQLMFEKKILAQIFSQSPNIKAFARIKEDDFKLKIAALFVEKNCNLQQLALEICVTNEEKNFWQFCLNNESSLDLAAVRRLLAFNKKERVVDFCKFLSAKNLLQSQEILNFVHNFSTPNFPLNGEDVMALGLRKEKVGQALDETKNLWADDNFLTEKSALLQHIKSKFSLN